MKINFQKLISIIAALAVFLSAISINVFADDSSHSGGGSGGSRSYLSSWYNSYIDWLYGNISYLEFSETTGYIIRDAGKYTGDKLRSVSEYIGNLFEKFGDGAKDYLSKWTSDFFDDYKVLSEKPTFDMNGAVAVLVEHLKDGYWDYQYMSKPCYIFNNGVLGFRGYFAHVIRNPDGSLYLSSSYGHIDVNSGLQSNEYYFYGDWRYEDDSKYPTNDEYEQVESFNFDNATDDELEDLLNRILEEIGRQNPDLSNVEGLLQAIYYRLGTLDSDNDSASISLLASAINNLSAQNNTDNSALLKELENIRESLSGDRGESSGGSDSGTSDDHYTDFDYDDLKSFLEDLMPGIDDMTKTEQVKAAFTAKFSFIEELKSLILRFISSYASAPTDKASIELHWKSNGSLADNILVGILNKMGYFSIDLTGGGTFDDYMPIIRGLIAAFIYITYAWNTYKKVPLYISGGGE